MAASVVAMLPLVIVFFVGQRYFVQGIVFTGIEK
jgi:multiple sugar transport system permease protein